jgi:hypothetical protein
VRPANARTSFAVCAAGLALLCLALAGCPKRGPESLSPWRAEMDEFFDDQVDLVRSRVRYRGKWNREFEESHMGRIGYSDAICLGVAKTLYRDTRWDKTKGLFIDFDLRKVVKGSMGGIDTVALELSERAPDITAIRESEIVGRPFFLYLKWVDVKARKLHWHLSPYSIEIEEEIGALIRSAERAGKAGGGVRDVGGPASGKSAP